MATVSNVSAGVYISTVDKSQYTRNTTQVSVGTIVLFSKQGPVDQIVPITGINQFLSTFGIPDPALGYGHYCAIKALTYMQKILVTRVHNNAKFGGLIVGSDSSGKLTLKQFTTPKYVDPLDHNLFYLDPNDTDFDFANDVFYIYGVDPNMYNGNYRIAIANVQDSTSANNPNTFQIQIFTGSSTTGKPTETWTVSRSQQTDGYGRQQYLEKVINGKSNYIRVLDNPTNTFSMLPAAMTTPTMMYLSGTTNLAYLSNGDSGLTNGAGGAIPVNQIPAILNGTDAFPSAIVTAPIPTKNSGWQLYYDREEVKFDLLINGGYTYPSVQRTMLSICDKRGDCFAILDIPYDKQGNKYDPTTDPIDYRTNEYGGLAADTPNGALYTPWNDVVDSYTGQTLSIPPSGHVAAVYCATDINYATWFAPAGLKRGLLETIDSNFVGTNVTYNQDARDAFELEQVNCTRTFEDIGTALWSAVTLQKKDSAESNVNVMRLLKYCARNIDTQLNYEVFDPNDEYLRNDIVQLLTNILEPIKLGRGLYEYTVICAGPGEPNSNNTYDDIEAGDLNVEVDLQPVIPAKRLLVKLVVNKAGVTIGSITTV